MLNTFTVTEFQAAMSPEMKAKHEETRAFLKAKAEARARDKKLRDKLLAMKKARESGWKKNS